MATRCRPLPATSGRSDSPRPGARHPVYEERKSRVRRRESDRWQYRRRAPLIGVAWSANSWNRRPPPENPSRPVAIPAGRPVPEGRQWQRTLVLLLSLRATRTISVDGCNHPTTVGRGRAPADRRFGSRRRNLPYRGRDGKVGRRHAHPGRDDCRRRTASLIRPAQVAEAGCRCATARHNGTGAVRQARRHHEDGRGHRHVPQPRILGSEPWRCRMRPGAPRVRPRRRSPSPRRDVRGPRHCRQWRPSPHPGRLPAGSSTIRPQIVLGGC